MTPSLLRRTMPAFAGQPPPSAAQRATSTLPLLGRRVPRSVLGLARLATAGGHEMRSGRGRGPGPAGAQWLARQESRTCAQLPGRSRTTSRSSGLKFQASQPKRTMKPSQKTPSQAASQGMAPG